MDAIKTGVFIAAVRREQNMTQAELAARLHVTDKAVSKWERGAGLPDISLIEPLAAALDVSVLELMQGRRIPAETVRHTEAAEVLTDILGMAKHTRANFIETARPDITSMLLPAGEAEPHQIPLMRF